jgi:hypothetical protein
LYLIHPRIPLIIVRVLILRPVLVDILILTLILVHVLVFIFRTTSGRRNNIPLLPFAHNHRCSYCCLWNDGGRLLRTVSGIVASLLPNRALLLDFTLLKYTYLIRTQLITKLAENGKLPLT